MTVRLYLRPWRGLLGGMADVSTDRVGPGWYADKRWPGEQRRWDGAKWLDAWRPVDRGSSPGAWIVVGVCLVVGLGLLTGVAFAVSDTAGLVALWVASVVSGGVLTVGVIGKAVEVGVRSARR